MRTTEFYGLRNINYSCPAGLGFEHLHIFTPTETGGYTVEVYQMNKQSGYCQDYYSGKRISKKKYEGLKKTCKQAF